LLGFGRQQRDRTLGYSLCVVTGTALTRSRLLVIRPTPLFESARALAADAVIASDFHPLAPNRSAYPQRDLDLCSTYILPHPDTFINTPVICCSFPPQEVL